MYGSLEECNDLNYPSLFARLDDYEVLKFIRANAFGDNIIAPSNVKGIVLTLRFLLYLSTGLIIHTNCLIFS